MSDYNWSQFTKRIPVKASKQDLYNAWTSQKDLESWFLRLSEFKEPTGYVKGRHDRIAKGDTFTWLWHGWPDDAREEGKILEANGKDRMRFTFGKAGIVTISVIEEEGENILELVQSDIPTDENAKVNFHMGCGKGWTFYLANLKSILEGGIDLRNRNINIQNVINA